ncbi:MAG: M24 family metallopeptidase [Oscillospiraceae bacterium]
MGKPSDKQREVFRVMTEAQQTMLDGIRPGMTAGEADALGRRVIQKAGLGDTPTTAVDTGIGLGCTRDPSAV